MTAIGIGLVFVGYSLGLYGWILVKGYDIPFTSMFNTSPWPVATKAGA